MIGAYFREVVCLECGQRWQPDSIMVAACPHCRSQWLDARYDYDAVQPVWAAGIPRRPNTLWRYAELLPLQATLPELSLNEGGTPLTRLYPYEALYQHQPIYVKDERANPTNSFKDRQAALSVMALKQQGITECVLASTGNAAVAYAAYCARAGIKLWLFLTSLVPAEKMREAALYGGEVVKVGGTYDETKKVAAEFAERKGIYFDRGAKAIPGKESMKTLAFEIAEQLGLQLDPVHPRPWAAPDWYIQAVSGGIGPLGVMKGFTELHHMGLIDKIPKLAVIQAEGCSPMVQAFREGKTKATPVEPHTLITVLATGEPGFAYTLLQQTIAEHGGTMLAIQDGDTFKAMRHVASRAGMSVEPATAVAFAGLEHMLREALIAPQEVVVINCSGHTFSAESHILGDQYEQYILDLALSKADQPVSTALAGLGAALKELDEQVTTLVVVDDNPNDRRLIRRLLQSYKRYRVYEARDGEEALHVIQDREPDLVVSDLTLPGMSGFELLERLKQDPHTAAIPVIIVSAKSLSPVDRQRLEAHAASIWQKGGLDTRGLVEHVVATLGHETLDATLTKAITAPLAPTMTEDAVSPSHTVLVIDDNLQDLRLAKRVITSGNYQVIEAQSGRDGLKAAYAHHPDLIVLDMRLPDLDGFSVLEALYKDVKLRDIPVIFHSAFELNAADQARIPANVRQIVLKNSLDRKQFLALIQRELG